MFEFTDDEKQINKVLKMNQNQSTKLLEDELLESTRKSVDLAIDSSESLLRSLGHGDKVDAAKKQALGMPKNRNLQNRPILSSWEQIVEQAEQQIPFDVVFEDLFTQKELDDVMSEFEKINGQFSEKTSIINKTDLTFLAVATALQVAKSLLFPYVAEKFDYGNSFDPEERVKHDDKSIKEAERKAKDEYKDKKLKTNKEGYWINMLYQGVPYDAIKGSKDLGLGLSGTNHRLHTLGHDPILGWIFGTANILTDVITMNNFKSFRVQRKPTSITSETVTIPELFFESYDVIKADRLNLPAAIFAQAQHFKSDIYTKQGLPIPVLATINENFASQLYKQNYDSLCFARDVKIVGVSFMVSAVIDMIIGLVHGLFRDENESKELYEVRTRKILLISNSIATSSSIVATCITKNSKALDIGSLLSTVSRLFGDIRFITKIKAEFIQNEIDQALEAELLKIDQIYNLL
ncbi:MAG: hypothetical protein RSC15_07300 [Lactococcus sp.]